MSKKTVFILFLAAFALYVLFLAVNAAAFMAKEGLQTSAVSVDEAALLVGGDDPDYAAVELIPGQLVNINSADGAQLQTLPGIGQALAEKIVKYRTENGDFACIEDIMNVKGVGEGRFADIAYIITVEDLDNEDFGG